jgi:hypothetical protein
MTWVLGLLRTIGIRGAIIGLLIIALGGLGYLHSEQTKDLAEANKTIGEKSEKIASLQGTVDTLKDRADRDERQATQSYNAAQLSCERRIQAAVEAMSAPITNPTPEVPENAPAGTPPVCNCPSVRLRDITKPFGFE